MTLGIPFSHDGKQLFSKSYSAEGATQGGKMFWGGTFAMKNAIQQSTKLALNEILRGFIGDVNALAVKG